MQPRLRSPAGGWNADLLWLVIQPERGQAVNRGEESSERALSFHPIRSAVGIIRTNGEQLFCFSGGRWEEEDGGGA